MDINELLDDMSAESQAQLASEAVTVTPKAPRGVYNHLERSRTLDDPEDPADASAVTTAPVRFVAEGVAVEERRFRVLASALPFAPTRAASVTDAAGVVREIARVEPDLDGREVVLVTRRNVT